MSIPSDPSSFGYRRSLLPLVLVAAGGLLLSPFLTRPLRAQQVPPLLNYQGRVVSNNVNFSGSGAFKFALVDAGGTTTYWSNDGTSATGDAPASAVTLSVTNGLYSVLLGDTSLPNMSAVPAGVFSNPDARLRVWFNDGVNGQQLLSPDQRLAAAGYAQIAAGLSLPATNATGTEGVITQGGSRLLYTKGSQNFFAGPGAGSFGVTAVSNTGIGAGALSANVLGNWNSALGAQAMQVANNAFSNSAFGFQALLANTTGSYNTATGVLALGVNTTGANNTATGVAALNNSNGSYNVAVGYFAGQTITSPSFNTIIGSYAGSSLTTGASNIALGYNAGSSLTTGSNNIAIGHVGVAGDANTIRLGSSSQTRTFIAGIRGVTTGTGGAINVVIDGNGQLGTISSSRRYKEDIRDMGEDASARLQALRPVTFRYRQPYANGEKPLQYGLIAEEVAEAFPELAVFNEAGQPETVKYHELAPLLLNEVKRLRAEKDELRARIERLEALVGSGDRPPRE